IFSFYRQENSLHARIRACKFHLGVDVHRTTPSRPGSKDQSSGHSGSRSTLPPDSGRGLRDARLPEYGSRRPGCNICGHGLGSRNDEKRDYLPDSDSRGGEHYSREHGTQGSEMAGYGSGSRGIMGSSHGLGSHGRGFGLYSTGGSNYGHGSTGGKPFDQDIAFVGASGQTNYDTEDRYHGFGIGDTESQKYGMEDRSSGFSSYGSGLHESAADE
uniref:Glycine rich superfamily member n=1 Tax=Mesocestoides corti TaxID=53468 RepID=A0A5K3EWZ7_MESCO